MVLAPLYDLVATHVWPQLSARLAMRFGRAATLEEVDGESFERFAQDAGLALPFLKRRAAELGKRVQALIAEGIAGHRYTLRVAGDRKHLFVVQRGGNGRFPGFLARIGLSGAANRADIKGWMVREPANSPFIFVL